MAEVAAFSEQLAPLQEKLNGLEAAAAPPQQQQPQVVKVDLPTEKRLRKYVGGQDDKVLEDWLADAERVIAAHSMKDKWAVEFLYNSLEEAARDKIRLRPAAEWNDRTKLFQVLREVFGERLSQTQMLQKFFGRRQKERESSQVYSHALMSLANHIFQNFPGAMARPKSEGHLH